MYRIATPHYAGMHGIDDRVHRGWMYATIGLGVLLAAQLVR